MNIAIRLLIRNVSVNLRGRLSVYISGCWVCMDVSRLGYALNFMRSFFLLECLDVRIIIIIVIFLVVIIEVLRSTIHFLLLRLIKKVLIRSAVYLYRSGMSLYRSSDIRIKSLRAMVSIPYEVFHCITELGIMRIFILKAV